MSIRSMGWRIICFGTMVLLAQGQGACVDVDEGLNPERHQEAVRYEKFLNALNTSDPKSIEVALSEYERDVAGSAQETRDKGFLAFRRFFDQVITCLNKSLWKEQDAVQASPVIATAKIIDPEKAHEAGLALLDSEGYVVVVEEQDFLLDAFYRFISPDLHQYLVIRSAEIREVFQEDGAIRIDFVELGRRCVNCEEYLRRYPQSPLIDDAREFHKVYVSTLLTGTNNTRVAEASVEYVDAERRGEISNAYRYLMRTYPSSRIAAVLRRYLPLLESGQYCDTKEIRAFLEREGVEWMFGSRRLYR